MSYYAYMSDEVSDVFPLTLAGREIMFRRPKLGQVIVLERTARRLMKQAESDGKDQGEAMTIAVVRTLDFIETLMVHDADKQFVEDQMLAGSIDWQDLMKAMTGEGDSGTADDEAPKPRKRVKAAAAAKTVASRGRTKR